MHAERLYHFVQIVECGSLSAAARRVHLTQPALSRNLRLLEEEIGARLFVREGRGLRLTAAGRALRARAGAVLDELASLSQRVRRAAERDYFDLKLGAVDSVATYLLPEVLEKLQRDFPELVVRLRVARSRELLEGVRHGSLDLAVVASSGPPPDVDAQVIGPYTLRYYGRKDRFAALSRARSIASLATWPVAQIEPSPGQAGVVSRDGVSAAVATNVASVKALVLAGFAVGDLPDYVLSFDERKRLVSVALELDPACAIFVTSAHPATRIGEERIRTSVIEGLRAAMRRRRSRRR
jgi:DNA-binding transcriptional LysR family regulator